MLSVTSTALWFFVFRVEEEQVTNCLLVVRNTCSSVLAFKHKEETLKWLDSLLHVLGPGLGLKPFSKGSWGEDPTGKCFKWVAQPPTCEIISEKSFLLIDLFVGMNCVFFGWNLLFYTWMCFSFSGDFLYGFYTIGFITIQAAPPFDRDTPSKLTFFSPELAFLRCLKDGFLPGTLNNHL